jgi:hypothetical protein
VKRRQPPDVSSDGFEVLIECFATVQ